MNMEKQMNRPERAAVYVRVSTSDQEKGYSPKFQVEDCKKVALERDGCLIRDEHIIDDSKSGKDDDRIGWKKLLEIASQGEIDAIYFWKLDRMMRSERHFYKNEEILDRLGIKIRFATQDLDDPFNRAIQVAVAADERRKIVERTQRGRKMAARSGKWVWGNPPYGYTLIKETKKLRKVPKEEKWIRQFFQWMVEGHLTLSAIQKRANELKVPCYSKGKRREERLKGYWHKKSIARILSNPIYTGTAYSFRFKRGIVGVNRFIKPDAQHDENEWATMSAPRIISNEIFEQCQAQLQRNRETSRRNIKHSYLFNKLIFCGKCGLTMPASTKLPKTEAQNFSKFYHGNRGAKWEKAILNYSRCSYCGHIAESRLEPVWKAIEGLLRDPEHMLAKLEKYNKHISSDKECKKKLGMAKKRIEAILKKRKKLDFLFLESDLIKEGEYMQRKADHKREELEAKKEIAQLSHEIAPRQLSGNEPPSLESLHDQLKQKLDSITYQKKSEIIHLLVNKITLYLDKNEAEVELNIRSPYVSESPYLKPDLAPVGVLSDERLC
jgi:site-specific DNA recombinase